MLLLYLILLLNLIIQFPVIELLIVIRKLFTVVSVHYISKMPEVLRSFIPKILERGRFFCGSSYMRKGQDCQCHYNSARLWYKNKDRCFIATGYALSEDGLWRCHSWVVQPMARTVRVWETTVKRVAYFGVVLTSEECENFVENNT